MFSEMEYCRANENWAYFYKINFKSSSFDNKTELVFVAEYFHGLKTAKFTDFSSLAMIAFQKI